MDVSDFELLDRYDVLLHQFVEVSPDLAKLLEKFGKIRKEMQMLAVEIDKRHLTRPDMEVPDAPFNTVE